MAIGSLLGAGMFVIMVVSGSCMIIKVELDSNELSKSDFQLDFSGSF